VPFRVDRHSYPFEIASQLRRTQDVKRRAMALKKAEKSKANEPPQLQTEAEIPEEPRRNGQRMKINEGLVVEEG